MSTAEPVRTYLLELFELDVASEPGAILELRRKRRTPGASSTDARDADARAREGAADRAQVDAWLQGLRAGFYDLDPEELSARIDAPPALLLPDLERQRVRLREVAAVRDEIAAAEADGRIDGDFLEELKQTLVAPEHERVSRQRRAFERLKLPRRRKAAQRSVRVFERQYPEVFALEAQWFGEIRRAKQTHKDRNNPAKLGIGIFGLYLLIRGAVHLIRLLSDE